MDDQKAEAIFAFTNTSSKPVTIEKISTSCGCTTAEPGKRIYQPGEKGEVKVILTFGGRKGVQEKSILVRTGGEKVDALLFKVEIPDVVLISPAELTWKIGTEVESKIFEVKVEKPGVTVVGAKPLGKLFTAQLIEGEPGKTYRISVRPPATGRAEKGTVRLDLRDPKPRAIYLKVDVAAE